ncbi:MAG: rhomboid family intramembrane serine protease [Thermomicrobiales bacterium]|nr:rhomboid family intramembrane serine protease [Thermomicrobiales bacterium]
MIPIGDENAGSLVKPYVNFALIGICVVVFLYEMILPERQLSALFFEWGAVPARIMSGEGLVTIFTSMFLHGGWSHIIGNMVFLYVFGDNIEDAMGHVQYLLFYLLCGIAAAALQIALDPTSAIPMIGASGAISGVMGAYLVLFPHGRVRALVFFGYFGQVILVPAWTMIGLWFGLQLLSAFASLGASGEGGVAFWAHVGGFIAGAVLVFLFRNRDAVARQNAVREQQAPPRQVRGRYSR